MPISSARARIIESASSILAGFRREKYQGGDVRQGRPVLARAIDKAGDDLDDLFGFWALRHAEGEERFGRPPCQVRMKGSILQDLDITAHLDRETSRRRP